MRPARHRVGGSVAAARPRKLASGVINRYVEMVERRVARGMIRIGSDATRGAASHVNKRGGARIE